MIRKLLAFAALAFLFTGCYTQLKLSGGSSSSHYSDNCHYERYYEVHYSDGIRYRVPRYRRVCYDYGRNYYYHHDNDRYYDNGRRYKDSDRNQKPRRGSVGRGSEKDDKRTESRDKRNDDDEGRQRDRSG